MVHTNSRERYCSNKCRKDARRDRSKAYKLANPWRVKRCSDKFQRKRRRPCRLCGGLMPWPSQGKRYCSEVCRKLVRKNKLRLRQREEQEEIWRHKRSIGCQHCGYNKHGAALDWHHPNKNKERIITAYSYFNKLGSLERDKCILLCSNCHRIEHVRITNIEHSNLVNLITLRKKHFG